MRKTLALLALLALLIAGCATTTPTTVPTAAPISTTTATATTPATVLPPTAVPTQPPTSTPPGTPTQSSIGLTFVTRYDATQQALYIYGITPGATIIFLGTPILPSPAPTNTPTPVPTNTAVPPPSATRPYVPPPPTATPLTAASLKGKIVFKTDRDGGAYPNFFAYYAVNGDGSALTRLDFKEADALISQLRPREGLSPDGKKVVLGEHRPCFSSFQSCGLYILDTVQDAALINSNDDISKGDWFIKTNFLAKSPAWSPNGDYITFASNHETRSECSRTMNIFKGRPSQNPTVRRLTDFCGGGDTDRPTFSPSGAQIAFWTQFPGPKRQINVLDTGPDDNWDFRRSNPHSISDGKSNDWDPLWVK